MNSEVCPFDEGLPVLHLRTSPSSPPRRGLTSKTFWAGPWQTYLMDHIIPSPTPQVYSPQGCQWLGGEIILQSKRSRKKNRHLSRLQTGKTSQLENIMLPRQMQMYRLNNQCLFGRFYTDIIAIITRGLERCFCFNLHKPWKSKHHVLSVGLPVKQHFWWTTCRLLE